MTKIKCPHQACRKEFERPVWVTNFSFTPTKETYQACPYCLTRIDNKTKTCNCTTIIVEPAVDSENENPEETVTCPETSAEPQICFKNVNLQTATMGKIETLGKQKASLLAELDELWKGATKRINTLEEEVAALKEEKEALNQLID